MASYFIGVDVGTGSARAGVFDLNGRMVGQATRAIEIYRPQADFVEQSSDNIWQAVCNAVRDAINQSDINPIQVKGLGFDATCSLVVLDKEGKPLTVSPSGRSEQNIIVWMDHRAITRPSVLTRCIIGCWTMWVASSLRRCKRRSCYGSNSICRIPGQTRATILIFPIF